MVIEGIFLKNNLEQAAPLCIVARLKFEGDGDEKLDVGDTDDLRLECGLGFVGGARHDGREKVVQDHSLSDTIKAN